MGKFSFRNIIIISILIPACTTVGNKPSPLFDQICNKYKIPFVCESQRYVEIIELKEQVNFEDNCDDINFQDYNDNTLSYEEKATIFSNTKEICLDKITIFSDDSTLRESNICCSFFNTFKSGQKSFMYFDKYKDKVVFSLGSGIVGFIEIKNLLDNKFTFEIIESNFKEIVSDENIYEPSWFGVKDILIDENKILISYSKQHTEDCYNTSVLIADMNLEYLQFNEFFTHNECVNENNKPSFSGHSAGGRLTKINEDQYLFTTGEYLNRNLAQDPLSNLGKTIILNSLGEKVKIHSIGHRNSQGLTDTDTNNLYLSTEHGPMGGDEINLLDLSSESSNYGWPISSYGEHYGNVTIEGAPLKKSHKIYGFLEPIYFFYPSIGISEIEKGPNKEFILTSLNNRRIYNLMFDEDYSGVTLIQSYKIGERIRDILYLKEENLYILSLEDTPKIGIFINN